MKYVVQLSYTNPAHEHVSLRRRVDTINRIVEAANEQQAVLRASQQQRSLGFMIKEAKIVKEKEKMKKKEVVVDDSEKTEVAAAGGMKEGFDPEPSDIAAHLVKKHGKGKVTKDHVDAYEKDRDSNKAIDKEAVMKHVQKMSEDVELVDEAQKKLKPSYWKAEWRLGTQSEVDKNNKKIYDKLAKTDPDKAKKFHDNLMKIRKEEVEQMTEDQASDMQKIQSMNKGSMTGGKAELKTHLKYLEAMHAHQKKHGLDSVKTKKKIGDVNRTLVQMGEEVEQVDETNMRFDPEAAARPKSSDVKNFLNRDKNPRAAAASKKYIRRMTKLGGLGPNQTKKDTEAHMKAHFEEVELDEASKEGKDVMRNMRAGLKSMDLRHGVDSDKRDAGYKMSPAVKAAQAKSDALSKVVKRPQAGTLAAAKMRKEEVEYIEEKLTAGDPASKWISDFVASDNPKFSGKTKKERINMALGAYYAAKKGKNEEVEHVEEAADPGKLRVVNKKVEAQASKDTKTSEKKSKATEKAINTAKSKKNPVNLEPVLAGDKVNNA